MGDFTEEARQTRSLERAEEVIAILKDHPSGDPITVQEIAEKTESYYEEVLHVLTALEVIGVVKRYRRTGAPREGARVAYSLETVAHIREARRRLGLDSSARMPRGDRRSRVPRAA